MTKVTPIADRKSDHLRINLEEDVKSDLSNGLNLYHFTHQALPELDINEINLGVEIFKHKLAAPILISSMTGGTPEAATINHVLATAAQETGVALALGSQRAAIDYPELSYSFQVRKEAPDVLLFANLGAVQLNYGYTTDHCIRAVEMIEADALILHLNPLQEALQTKGDTNFKNLLMKIEQVCKRIPVPVVIKEVGWGISGKTAIQLVNVGVSAIDVAGAGGTSWSQVEMYRAQHPNQAHLASLFRGWGIPTAHALIQCKESVPDLLLFASGGIRSGLEMSKCIALGATLCGMASPFLKAASESIEITVETIQELTNEIQVCMFAAGVKNISDLQRVELRTG